MPGDEDDDEERYSVLWNPISTPYRPFEWVELVSDNFNLAWRTRNGSGFPRLLCIFFSQNGNLLGPWGYVILQQASLSTGIFPLGSNGMPCFPCTDSFRLIQWLSSWHFSYQWIGTDKDPVVEWHVRSSWNSARLIVSIKITVQFSYSWNEFYAVWISIYQFRAMACFHILSGRVKIVIFGVVVRPGCIRTTDARRLRLCLSENLCVWNGTLPLIHPTINISLEESNK